MCNVDMKLDLVSNQVSKILEFEKKMSKLNPQGLKILRIRLKPTPGNLYYYYYCY